MSASPKVTERGDPGQGNWCLPKAGRSGGEAGHPVPTSRGGSKSRWDAKSSPCGGDSVSGTGGVWERGSTGHQQCWRAIPALPPRWTEDAHGFAGALLSLWCRKALAPPGPLQRCRPSSLPTHPRRPHRGGIIRRNHGNPGQRLGCWHQAVLGSPHCHGLTRLCGQWGAAVVGGRACQCLWDAVPTSPGHRCAHGGLAGLWFGLAQQGCSCRGLSGCSISHQGTPWPQQPPLCHGQGFPGILTCLFYFAVLGWSHCGALGQFSPPIPSLLLLDQVGPRAAIPCPLAALTPWG